MDAKPEGRFIKESSYIMYINLYWLCRSSHKENDVE